MKQILIVAFASLFFLTGCTAQPTETSMAPASPAIDPEVLNRHNSTIPEPYAGLSNPLNADDHSASRGEALYTLHCTSCHGDRGMGDGPAGQVLVPPATPIAQTSALVGDDYLFWRISEGGTPFNTSMPSWQGTLDEQDIWSLIIYLRIMEQGQAGQLSALPLAADISTTHANAVSHGEIE
ncbi:MAG: cytochrome c [Chloroflexi bacterium]|nr:MAG: cytochrome c [Chloroflexota bacterium]MBL1194981.1 cytochrome c [Chloroflexota bacterium]NOH12269.1 cytochrome c [Chloroflexota bacterium]